MREVKFRAWDKQREFFMELGRLYQEDIVYCVEEHPDIGNEFGLLESNDVVLMQYTGLKDKNQKEIFEGDIGFDNHSENDGIVKFKEGKFIYEWDNICEDLCEVNKDMEVIGNIHEHSHLLEGDTHE